MGLVDTSTIDGAQPKKRFVLERNVEKEKIEGSEPKPSYQKRYFNKPDSFKVHDIEGARPRTNMFKTTRVVDPLDPEYTLPSFEPIVYETPRFIRDSFDVSDIEGTRTKVSLKLQTRNSYDVSDIEGAKAGWRSHHRALIEKMRRQGASRRKVHSMDVSDIINKGFKTKREVDPLRPVYRVNGEDIKDCEKGTAPKPLPKETSTPFFSLHTNDVKGAQSGTASTFARLRVHERSEFRTTNDVSGISGAKANTLKRGLKSKRQTNPLMPRYKYLHGCDTPTPPNGAASHFASAYEILRNKKNNNQSPSSRPGSAASFRSNRSDSRRSKREEDEEPAPPLSTRSSPPTMERKKSSRSNVFVRENGAPTSFRKSSKQKDGGSSSRPNSARLQREGSVFERRKVMAKQAEIDAVRDLPF